MTTPLVESGAVAAARRPAFGRNEVAGLGLALLATAGHGSSSVFVKLAYDHGATVSEVIVARVVVATVVVWVLVGARRARWRLPARRRMAVLAFGAGVTVPWVLSSLALVRLPAGTAGVLLFTYPAVVAIIEAALGREAFGGGKLACVAAGIGGVALLLQTSVDELDGVAVVCALGASVALGILIVSMVSVTRNADALAANAWILVGGLVPMVVAAVLLGDLRAGADAPDAWPLLVLGGTSAMGTVFFLPSVRRIGATRAALASNAQPIVTVALGAVILGERLAIGQAAGVVLIVASVAALPFLGRGPAGPPNQRSATVAESQT